MATIDNSDPVLKRVCLQQHDIDALNRLLTLCKPRKDHALEDAQAIIAVAELIVTAEAARELAHAAIKRMVKERQEAGDPAFREPDRDDDEDDYQYILPQDRSICAMDCLELLEAIQANKLDEFDLKNEINAQWTCGYNQRAKEDRVRARMEAELGLGE